MHDVLTLPHTSNLVSAPARAVLIPRLSRLACLQAYVVTSLNVLVLFLSCTCFLMETMPELKQCAERPRRSSGSGR